MPLFKVGFLEKGIFSSRRVDYTHDRSLFFIGFLSAFSHGFMMLVSLGGAILLAAQTPIEEARLIEKFWDEYRQYMAETGRYFPQWCCICDIEQAHKKVCVGHMPHAHFFYQLLRL